MSHPIGYSRRSSVNNSTINFIEQANELQAPLAGLEDSNSKQKSGSNFKKSTGYSGQTEASLIHLLQQRGSQCIHEGPLEYKTHCNPILSTEGPS